MPGASCSCREIALFVLMSASMCNVHAEKRNGDALPPPSSRAFLCTHLRSVIAAPPCGPHNEISMTPQRQFETRQMQYHAKELQLRYKCVSRSYTAKADTFIANFRHVNSGQAQIRFLDQYTEMERTRYKLIQ